MSELAAGSPVNSKNAHKGRIKRLFFMKGVGHPKETGFISYDRLSADWQEDEACPMLPDLAIESISPDQSFGEMAEKVMDYLTAGVLRVWVVDPRARSITVFYPDAPPQTCTGDMVLTDSWLERLELTAQQVFEKVNLPA